jgi:hypothetical protein
MFDLPSQKDIKSVNITLDFALEKLEKAKISKLKAA